MNPREPTHAPSEDPTADDAAFDVDTQSSPEKGIWRIGTLTYTRGGLAVLFGWLLWGDFAWQMRERAVGSVAQLLLKHLKASDFFVGLLVGSIPSAIGLLLGPVISTMSDRHRGPWGRRIPFLLAPTPFAVLALVGLAFTSQLGHIVSALPGLHGVSPQAGSRAVFAILWTVFEIAAVTTSGIFYALINDVVPHDLVGRAFGGFRAVSLLAGIVFNHWILKLAEAHFQAIFISVAIIYGAGLTVMCLKVKEGQYPPPQPLVERGDRDVFGPVLTYFRETCSNPYYLWIYIGTTLAMIAPGPVNSFSLFYAKSIGMDVGTYGNLLSLTYIVSFCLSFLLGWLADRFHPLRLTIVSIALYGAATLAGGFVARTPQTFAWAFVAHGVLSGCLFTAMTPTFQRLFPKARFGEFYSAASLLQGGIFVILPPAVGALLDATGHVYRYTFLESGLFAILGTAILCIVYRNFLLHGGPKHYVPPE